MKTVSFVGAALVAMGVGGAAHAADPITLKLGGYTRYYVGYADNDDSVGDFQEFDVKGANEVYFLGSTTLDNGLKVSVEMQFEAGGNADTRNNNVDEAYVTLDGAFGRVIIGAENNAAYLMHVSAPDAAGTLESGEINLMGGTWVVRPSGVNSLQKETGIDVESDAEKITYISPSFGGLSVGFSYVPSLGDHDQRPKLEDNLTDMVAAGLSYKTSYRGVGIKASAGYLTVLDENEGVSGTSDYDEVSAGLQVSYAGFTVGGSYANINHDTTTDKGLDGRVFTAGIQYASGPAAVSFAYMDSKAEGAVGGGDDRGKIYQASGKYNLGPGIAAVATVGHVDFEDEGADANDGWTAFSGLKVSF